MYIMIFLVLCGRIINFPVVGEPTMSLFSDYHNAQSLKFFVRG